MYKVKLFTATSQEELEKSINAFLPSIDNFPSIDNLFDIKYEIAGGYCHNAMIIYSEKEHHEIPRPEPLGMHVDKISFSKLGKKWRDDLIKNQDIDKKWEEIVDQRLGKSEDQQE